MTRAVGDGSPSRWQIRGLIESEQHFQEIIEDADEAMLLLTASGRVRFANAAAVKRLGLDELVGQQFAHLPIATVDANHTEELLTDAVAQARSGVSSRVRDVVKGSDEASQGVEFLIDPVFENRELDAILVELRDYSLALSPAVRRTTADANATHPPPPGHREPY